MGLRTIHIFALANVLQRPIVLLDKLEKMESGNEYCSTFLPVLHAPAECRDKTGRLNAPLTVAWANNDNSHFVPLCGIQGRAAARVPLDFLPQAYGGVDRALLFQYLDVDADGFVTLGDGQSNFEPEFWQLNVNRMEQAFFCDQGISPSLVADFYKDALGGFALCSAATLVEQVKRLYDQRSLHRCLNCFALNMHSRGYTEADLRRGGWMHTTMLEQRKQAMAAGHNVDPTHPLYDKFKFGQFPDKIFQYIEAQDILREVEPAEIRALYFPEAELKRGGKYYNYAKTKTQGLAPGFVYTYVKLNK